MIFLHHPDGLIVIGALRYPLPEFLIDEPDYALPDGMLGRVYEPGVQHWLTDGSMQHAGPLPWPDGDAYLSREAEYRAAFAARTAPPPPSLDEVKAQARRLIDSQAEERRLVHITPGSGQALVYVEKQREAKAALAALADAEGKPVDPAWFPLIAAELGVTGNDLEAVAATVIATAEAWIAVAAAIESTRLRAKRDVDAAQSAAEIDAVIAAIVWGA